MKPISSTQYAVQNITLLALGSRGDVQPFVALGLGLRAAGYHVRIAAAEDYRDIVEPHGLDFAPLVGSIRDFMDRQMVYALLDAPENPLRFITGMMDAVRPLIVRLVADVYSACRHADAVFVSTLGYYGGYDVAQALDIPVYVAHLHPNVPTRAYPHVFLPHLPPWLPAFVRARYNRLGHKLTEAAYWAFILGPLNQARREVLGLPPLLPLDIIDRTGRPLRPVLHAYSPLLTRTPPDWGRDVHVTGYWFVDEPPGWTPDPGLVNFLDAGEPPVYVGFGSNLVGRDPDHITRLVLGALRRTGQRGIISSGWGDLGNIDLPDTVYKVESVPHSWLFRKVRAVVSHSGAGTLGATLRAGVPPITVPFFGDQLFWSARVARLGLGPNPIPRRHLSEDRLAAAITQVLTDKSMRDRAVHIGRLIKKEHGVQNALNALGWG
jgi:sterol 3beta-glucosyltransferase